MLLRENGVCAGKARRFQVDFGLMPLIPKHNLQPLEPTMRQERTVQARSYEEVDSDLRSGKVRSLTSYTGGQILTFERVAARCDKASRVQRRGAPCPFCPRR